MKNNVSEMEIIFLYFVGLVHLIGLESMPTTKSISDLKLGNVNYPHTMHGLFLGRKSQRMTEPVKTSSSYTSNPIPWTTTALKPVVEGIQYNNTPIGHRCPTSTTTEIPPFHRKAPKSRHTTPKLLLSNEESNEKYLNDTTFLTTSNTSDNETENNSNKTGYNQSFVAKHSILNPEEDETDKSGKTTHREVEKESGTSELSMAVKAAIARLSCILVFGILSTLAILFILKRRKERVKVRSVEVVAPSQRMNLQ